MNYCFMRFPDFKRKAVTLSYDDGMIFDKKLIEIMDKNGLKGTFNIDSGLFSEDGKRRMTQSQAVELYTNSGHEVAVHGKEHLPLGHIPTAMAIADILNDRIALENLFGTIISGMAYAYGSYSKEVVDMLESIGIEYARTTSHTERFELPANWLGLSATCHHGNPKLMELARAFVEEKPSQYYWGRSPKMFYLWGHSYEFNDGNCWHIIEQFAEYIGNREDIWYATNIEICRYAKAYKALKFSADGKWVYNPTAIDIYLEYFEEEILVKSGETKKLK